MKKQTVIVERIFNAGKETVWRAITEKELMKQWYFNLAEFETEPGFKFEFMGGPEDGTQYKHLCEIIEVIPQQKLTYSWRYEGYEGITFVTFELYEESKKTRLKLTHTGFETFPPIPDFAVHNFEEGWNHIINVSLKDFLEKNKQHGQ
jgi:uncharacterized protein YndB with AHSA1/START domain